MKLRKNFKIENNGIWISKKELESLRDHYAKTRKTYYDLRPKMFYLGKEDVFIDLLKMFENEEV